MAVIMRYFIHTIRQLSESTAHALNLLNPDTYCQRQNVAQRVYSFWQYVVYGERRS